jgi:hypothetical protein
MHGRQDDTAADCAGSTGKKHRAGGADSAGGPRWWLAMAVILGGGFQAATLQACALPAGGRGDAQAPVQTGAQVGAPKPAGPVAGQPWQVTPAGELARPLMPDPSLEPPANQVPVLFAYAQGVQRYVCKEKEQAKGSFEWTLKEPQAKLADVNGREIGSHSAGPTWQLADGSKAVKKKLIASVPALQSDGVPWLLLETEPSGKGALARTQYVQRVDTVGGAAPATGCDAAHAGKTLDVDYRATYVFYAPRQAT